MINNNEVEKGLLKEKILMSIKCTGLAEKIESDNNIERLREVYEYLKYLQRERKRIRNMSKTEYARHCKVEIDRSIKELEKKGCKLDKKIWGKHGMKMLLAISKIKDAGGLLEKHENAS